MVKPQITPIFADSGRRRTEEEKRLPPRVKRFLSCSWFSFSWRSWRAWREESLVPAAGRAGESVACCSWLCLRDFGVSLVNICTTKPSGGSWQSVASRRLQESGTNKPNWEGLKLKFQMSSGSCGTANCAKRSHFSNSRLRPRIGVRGDNIADWGTDLPPPVSPDQLRQTNPIWAGVIDRTPGPGLQPWASAPNKPNLPRGDSKDKCCADKELRQIRPAKGRQKTKPIWGGVSSLKCQVLSGVIPWSGLQTSHFTLQTRPKAVCAKRTQLGRSGTEREGFVNEQSQLGGFQV